MDDAPAHAIADQLTSRGSRLAVAESLTGGMLSSQLAKEPGASSWLVGGIVAYTPEVKQKLLGVPPGPVVTEETALRMATGVAGLLGSDVAVAVTGVGGPDPDEGKPAGTVWVGLCAGEGTAAHLLELDGDPPTILERTCEEALRLLEEHLRGLPPAPGREPGAGAGNG
jgi:nicotinamide-nucleotide amidase